MPSRLIVLAAAATVGTLIWRSLSARAMADRVSLPTSDGLMPDGLGRDPAADPDALTRDLPLRSLEAGMPADRHADADRPRPGFAEYARGA